MPFILSDSLKNLLRYRKRYLPLGCLLLVCALLSGGILTLASAAKQYLEATPFSDSMDPLVSAMRGNVVSLDSTASLAQAGVLSVSVIALFYVSSMAVNERMGNMGILYSVGLSGKTILGGMLLEIAALACLTLLPGCVIGKTAAEAWLHAQVSSGVMPGEICAYLAGGTQTAVLLIFAAVILLLPVGILIIKIAKSDPCDLLGERN